MKTKKFTNLYRKPRPGGDAKVLNRSGLTKPGGAKKHKRRKPDKLKGGGILQFSLEGIFIREYSSMREAAKVLKIGYGAIHYCLTGRQKTGGNFKWRYKIDPNFDEGIFDIPPMINHRTLKLQPVVQYTMEGEFVKEYASLEEAAEIRGIPAAIILLCIRGKQRSTNKYQWRLKKDAIKDGKIMDIDPARKQAGRAVCKFDMDGKFIREYPSMADVARDEGVSREAISSRLERKKCAGYQWRFKVEVEKDGKIIDIGPLEKRKFKYKIESKKTSFKYSYPVSQYGLDGTFIREYPSIIDAAEKTNIAINAIITCAVKRFKSTRGFQWRFKEEVVQKDGKITDIGPAKAKKISPLYFQAVCQFERDGKFIREYPSIIDAAEKTNIIRYGILSCAVRRFKSSGGFLWRFKDEGVMADKPVRKSHRYYSLEVCKFDVDGTFIRAYPSIWAAANITGIPGNSIFLCASKKLKKGDDYLWRFKKDLVKKGGTIKDIDISPAIPLDISRYSRPVCQFGLDGKFIREYPSILVAAHKTNAYRRSIYMCTQKKMKITAGFQWRLKEEVVKNDGKIRDIEPARAVMPHFLPAVCQFELDGKFIREYPSILVAAHKTNAYRRSIYMCTQKKMKITAGFQWRYKDDPEFKNGITDIAPYERIKYRGGKGRKKKSRSNT